MKSQQNQIELVTRPVSQQFGIWWWRRRESGWRRRGEWRRLSGGLLRHHRPTPSTGRDAWPEWRRRWQKHQASGKHQRSGIQWGGRRWWNQNGGAWHNRRHKRRKGDSPSREQRQCPPEFEHPVVSDCGGFKFTFIAPAKCKRVTRVPQHTASSHELQKCEDKITPINFTAICCDMDNYILF